MPRTILTWGAAHRVTPRQSVAEELKNCGKNFGNLLIGNSIREILSINNFVSHRDVNSPEQADAECDQVVIPAANFLWKGFDLGHIADFLEKTSLPVAMIGVGAQASDRNLIGAIHPGTLRLMKLVAERSKRIGVRGYYTAEVLSSYGIHNVEVIGCPSLYSKKRRNLSIETSRLTDVRGISVNFSRRVAAHSFSPQTTQSVENKLLEFAISKQAIFVAQDEEDEIATSEIHTSSPAMLQYFNQINPNAVHRFFANNTRYFLNVADWTKYIIDRPASIGTRLHGNLIALINKVPAVLLVHDSRTMEIANLWRMPSVAINSLDDVKQIDFEEILQCADYQAFETMYRVRYDVFCEFLDRNDLLHDLQ